MRFSHSLKLNHIFRRLYRSGKNAANRYLVLYCRGNGSKGNRIGITVNAKLAHAVHRNRVRRQLREIYRLHEQEFQPGHDLVVVVRSRAIGARPLSHKRTLFRQRWNGTGVHDDAHRHKGEGESEKAAQQRRSGRAPESAPRIGPAMKGQFHRSRSFSPKTWSYMKNQDDDTVW